MGGCGDRRETVAAMLSGMPSMEENWGARQKEFMDGPSVSVSVSVSVSGRRCRCFSFVVLAAANNFKNPSCSSEFV